jgi:phosphoribosylformylglycinamidine synthase
VLTGDGINCEKETAHAFELASGQTKIIHINDLLSRPQQLHEYQGFALPGGFSFGDDLGSGQVLALKLQSQLGNELQEYISRKNPVIGICNGFQALTKLGLLPEPFAPRTMALARNTSGEFMNRWVSLGVEESSVCVWTKGLTALSLPIRHGEGKVTLLAGEEEKIHRKLISNGQIPLRYTEEVNGSFARIAGVCDPLGLVFGLMPHPEAAVSLLQHPQSSAMKNRSGAGLGLKIFENGVAYMRGK